MILRVQPPGRWRLTFAMWLGRVFTRLGFKVEVCLYPGCYISPRTLRLGDKMVLRGAGEKTPSRLEIEDGGRGNNGGKVKGAHGHRSEG